MKKVFTNLKPILYLVLALVVFYILWQGWTNVTTDSSSAATYKSMESYDVPYYICTMDGDDYAVNYLNEIDELSVIEDTGICQDALLIYPQEDGSYEYSIIIYDEGQAWQISLDVHGENSDLRYQEVLNKHHEHIEYLFKRARTKWNLEI